MAAGVLFNARSDPVGKSTSTALRNDAPALCYQLSERKLEVQVSHLSLQNAYNDTLKSILSSRYGKNFHWENA
jgi:hypothetical protein